MDEPLSFLEKLIIRIYAKSIGRDIFERDKELVIAVCQIYHSRNFVEGVVSHTYTVPSGKFSSIYYSYYYQYEGSKGNRFFGGFKELTYEAIKSERGRYAARYAIRMTL